jgi:hypothetical protein
MKDLTLQEKITIKGILSRYHKVGPKPRLNMKDAVWFFYILTGRSVAFYPLYS